MNLFEIAEENFLISFAVVLSVGILQGSILGRGIRKRFPGLKRHARIVSFALLLLFSFNALASVLKFAVPEKITITNFTVPTTTEEGYTLLINVLGLNAGFVTIVVMFISITIILFLRFAELSKPARYFIFTISVITVLVAGIGRFTDFIPTVFQILMYAFYQVGFTIGIFLVTRRQETDVLPEFE